MIVAAAWVSTQFADVSQSFFIHITIGENEFWMILKTKTQKKIFWLALVKLFLNYAIHNI
jgi:hypothetical protein